MFCSIWYINKNYLFTCNELHSRFNCNNISSLLYPDICKSQIHVQPLIDVQSSNPFPISTQQTYVPQIYVFFLLFLFKWSNRRSILKFMSFFKFSNRRPILKSVAVSHFLKPKSNDVTDVTDVWSTTTQ